MITRMRDIAVWSKSGPIKNEPKCSNQTTSDENQNETPNRSETKIENQFQIERKWNIVEYAYPRPKSNWKPTMDHSRTNNKNIQN